MIAQPRFQLDNTVQALEEVRDRSELTFENDHVLNIVSRSFFKGVSGTQNFVTG